MILETNARDAMANALDDLINTGGAGTLQFQIEAGSAEVATINLQNPAFGASATGVLTLQGVPLQDSSATGNASPVSQAQIFNGSAALVLEMTVAVSGSEIDLDNLTIDASDIVTLTALTITVPQ